MSTFWESVGDDAMANLRKQLAEAQAENARLRGVIEEAGCILRSAQRSRDFAILMDDAEEKLRAALEQPVQGGAP